MKKIIFLTKALIIYLFLYSSGISKELDFFTKGLQHFKKKELDKSKIMFEKDLVFNPKSEKSYLYLAKIFNLKNNEEEQEINLNNVLLINPKNDEAIYMLTLIKIKQSDYGEAKKLLDKFVLVCKSFCSKESEIKKKLKKFMPKDEKSNN
tara:strand:+ start:295 stop:744 length:450 start_codon:yes stop_codon:yes gene_type:complete